MPVVLVWKYLRDSDHSKSQRLPKNKDNLEISFIFQKFYKVMHGCNVPLFNLIENHSLVVNVLLLYKLGSLLYNDAFVEICKHAH